MTTFVDTSYLLALVLDDDEHHARAVAWQQNVTGSLLTSEYVLVEFVDALSSGPLRSVALATLSLLRESPSVRIIPASTSLMDEGLTLFQARPDKEWGLTDCISFAIMESASVNRALTSDHHFEQAGFEALLKKDA